MNYENYQAEDFAADLSFRSFVNHTDPVHERFWKEWVSTHPEKLLLVEEAIHLVEITTFTGKSLSKPQIEKNWQQLAPRLKKQRIHLPGQQSFSFSHLPGYIKVAAAITGILLVAAVLFLYLTSTIAHHTPYGQLATIQLPDGSSVVLNANSRLSYKRYWFESQPRQVHLAGEAFFSVRKKPASGNAKFIVHTNDLQVEVLGTEFNVSRRRNRTQIVLNSGKIKLNTEQASAIDDLIMKPGDLVEFSQTARQATVKQVNPDKYSSWKHRELLFEDTPVREIIQLLEDTYGLEIQVESPGLLGKKYTGTFRQVNQEIILEALSTLYGLEIEKKQKTVILKSIKE